MINNKYDIIIIFKNAVEMKGARPDLSADAEQPRGSGLPQPEADGQHRQRSETIPLQSGPAQFRAA